MKSIKLGDIPSSKLGFGAMSLVPNIYSTPGDFTDEDGVALLQRVINLGITHIDTAILYGNGHNEKVVGKFLACLKPEERAKLCIATKTGFDLEADRINNEPGYIRRTCEESLQRLGTYIDIFYLHRIDTSVAIEDSMKVMKELIAEGKIKSVGLSEASANTIRRAHAMCKISAIQLEWSLWSRDVEDEIVPTCRELGIGIVAYSPLGRGMLAGTVKKREDLNPNDWRLLNPRFEKQAIEANLQLVSKIEEIASKKGCTTAQLSLAWVLAQGDDVVPIPGTSKVKNLESNVGALDVVLSKDEVYQLSNAVPIAAVVGDRYQEGFPTFKDN